MLASTHWLNSDDVLIILYRKLPYFGVYSPRGYKIENGSLVNHILPTERSNLIPLLKIRKL